MTAIHLPSAVTGPTGPTGSTGPAGAGFTDGDKGDITISGTGTILTIDNDAVTYAKIQNVSATDKVLGRSSSGAGDIEEIALTSAGRALIDDPDVAAQRTTLGLVIGTNVQAYDSDLTTWAGITPPSGALVGDTDTQTLTNKRVTKRVETLTDAATVTPNSDSYDGGKLLTLSQTTTIANPTGTPTGFQQYILRIKSTSARSLSWGSQFRGGTDITLPTTTSGASKTDYFGFQWNSDDTKWDILAKATGY